MDIRNLTAEQKASILQYGKDGFDPNELTKLGLTADEAEALYNGLAGNNNKIGDELSIGKKVGKMAAKAGEKAKKNNNGLTALCGLGGLGVLGACALGAPIPGGRLIGGILLGVAFLTSCQDIEFPDHVNNYEIGVGVNYSIIMPEDPAILAELQKQTELIKQIVEKQDKGIELSKKEHEELMNTLKGMAEILLNAGNSIDAVAKHLIEQGTKLDNIVELLTQLNYSTTTIIEILQGIGTDLTAIYDALTKGLENQDEILAVQKEILNTVKDLYNQDPGITEKLDAIISELNKGNELSDATNKLLLQVLDKMNDLKNEPTDTSKLEALLEKVLAEITSGVTKQQEMDEKTHTLLQTIIEKLEQLDNNMGDGFIKILAKLDTLDDDTKALLQSILDNIQNFNVDMKTGFGDVVAKLDTLGNSQKEILAAIVNLTDVTDTRAKDILKAINDGQELDAKQYENLRELIIENNKIAQGTQDLVKELGPKADRLGDGVKEILEKLGKVGNNNVTVDLTEITELLKAIKEDTAKNGETLVRIEDKLNLAAQTLNTILVTVEGLGEDTKATLLKILAKIPEGCKCEGVDLTVLIEKLDQIIIELQKEPEGNHEGILDDFEETLDGLI